jgi:hypothetical protein
MQDLELRRGEIPLEARPFVGLAQRVGVFEDGHEPDAVEGLTESDRQALLFFRWHYPMEVDQWLRGDEAMGQPPSMEFMAFSCLYLAAEFLDKTHRSGACMTPHSVRTDVAS